MRERLNLETNLSWEVDDDGQADDGRKDDDEGGAKRPQTRQMLPDRHPARRRFKKIEHEITLHKTSIQSVKRSVNSSKYTQSLPRSTKGKYLSTKSLSQQTHVLHSMKLVG